MFFGSFVCDVDTCPPEAATLSRAFAEHAWRKNYKRTGNLLAMSLAGVDTALWDLVARSQNSSVCALIAAEFGSTCKAQMPVYGSNGDRSKAPADIVATWDFESPDQVPMRWGLLRA